MLRQKIVGSEMRAVKYHDKVKFLHFECNNCHKTFAKLESYSRKQLKIHKNACCFCSPDCRTKYFKRLKKAVPLPKDRGTSIFNWINKIINS